MYNLRLLTKIQSQLILLFELDVLVCCIVLVGHLINYHCILLFFIDAIMSRNGSGNDGVNIGLIIGIAAAVILAIITTIIVVIILYWRFRSTYINVQYNMHVYYI